MVITFFSSLEAILLVTALSIDAFVASFAYGTNKIKIPFTSVTTINVICSTLLAMSLFLGSIVSQYIPSHLIKGICFTILFVLGTIKLFDSSIKSFIRKNKNLSKELKFSMFNLKLILNIYADPQEADRDYSRVLSPLEATSLAIAVSLDGLAAGFGVALVNINLMEVVLFSLISDMVAVMLGCYIGNKIAKKLTLNISWLSGVLLIILAILKL
ncbi:putative sporulation protein YtaF [Anaerovirgula multivorans]|uniref:Putative sporulation protein YtaF n=1 Tax=Anaerovirgula multivorans TaxID=312168 RepID=A0A239KN91_9FIRM|nr:sporulation membrane protein YtaF [Anaerovirgula multivorans]SNT19182.1 putative sporulation protein YtaF [Anaerovirgula multivorans]